MTRIALCAACLCALSQVSVPMPSGVPVTLQTFAVALCAGILGSGRGAVCVLVYLALGAAGLPVFAGFSGGFAKFAGPTGGFLIGFIPMAALCGVKKHFWLAFAGLAVCHAYGAAHFALVAGTSYWKAILTVSAPYIIKDVLSVVLGMLLSRKVAGLLRYAR